MKSSPSTPPETLRLGTVAPALWPLRQLLWPAFAALAVAFLLSLWLLPRDFGGRGTDAFESRVLTVEATNPNLSLTSFPLPEGSGVVLWVEGMEKIPATHPVR